MVICIPPQFRPCRWGLRMPFPMPDIICMALCSQNYVQYEGFQGFIHGKFLTCYSSHGIYGVKIITISGYAYRLG